ncbi:MAG: hypothetical protein F4213_02095 [Boseongicola sp. SB0677_bin_26]|nr:hypothetical protein [Boseongicola sp. SB0665_bin_10]MYG24807.1 hypothetical protein [Boseongicola sp. SB0677_bin_26]
MPRGAMIAAVASFALWHAAMAAGEDEGGTFELVTSFVREHVTIEHAGRSVTGGSMRGTNTVTRSDGGPFVEGESNVVECVIYATRTEAGLDLEAPCTNTDSSGDTWFWIARRTAGDMEVGGEGRRELLGGTGRYAGVRGTCTYSTRYLTESEIVSVAGCKWLRP